MSRNARLPHLLNSWRILDAAALAQLIAVAVGCATVAGFEDFTSKGNAGAAPTLGGSTSSAGSSSYNPGGGTPPTTGGTSPCGYAEYRCCASANSCLNGACCFNGNCIQGGMTCGSASVVCQQGHCQGCGQLNQNCCGGTSCEYGLECANNQCRACGASEQSCCDNGDFPKCSAGVCVGSNGPLGNMCSTNCGASGQPCCTGATVTGSGCELGTNLQCSTTAPAVCR
jgi:hypothetical protein